MVFPLTEEGDNAEVFPAVDATAVEFDTYSEAKAYVGYMRSQSMNKEL